MSTYDPKPPARHHAPQQIAPDTHLIRQIFGEGQAPVAVYVNSMVITGANVAAAQAKMRRVVGGPATPLPTQVDLDALIAAATAGELVGAA